MILDDILEGENTDKLTPKVWDKIATQGESFFDDFPFLKDPKFMKLNPIQQRLLLAWSLRGTYGFLPSEAYFFATGRKRGVVPNNTAAKAAKDMLASPRLKYFTDKLDWNRVRDLGFTTNKIIEAETEIAYSDITEYLDDEGMFVGDLKDLPVNLRRAIKTFEIQEHHDKQGKAVRKYKLQLWDKGASLQRMQKIKGMHIDVAENTSTSVHINGEMSSVDAAKAYQDMMRDNS